MNREKETIEIIQQAFQQPSDSIFISDAQPFTFNGARYLFSTDDYSSEDSFRTNNAEQLGWNLTAATLSDILAAGGIPVYFGHSMCVSPNWDHPYIEKFAKGIYACLKAANTGFMGGDTSFTESWKYTGIALGKEIMPLNRSGAMVGDNIYMTGKIGAGNVEAALQLFSDQINGSANGLDIRFPVRMREASLIRGFANACIDSSDGVLNALISLAEASNVGFYLDHLPVHDFGKELCSKLGMDERLLFMGESGEYELVFTVPQLKVDAFNKLIDIRKLDIRRLGEIREEGRRLKAEVRSEVRSMDLTGFDIRARDYDNPMDYIELLTQFIRHKSEG